MSHGATVIIPKTKSCNILLETFNIDSHEVALKHYTELVTPIIMRIIDLWEGNSSPISNGPLCINYGDSPCKSCEYLECEHRIDRVFQKTSEKLL
jgi:hypothetical protein